ncbi:MAG: hypothetical protein H6922_06270 [Pseudomonadaceae bacterium]|nr:hypothetical protein [Pseudomonadaceae bacterium]
MSSGRVSEDLYQDFNPAQDYLRETAAFYRRMAAASPRELAESLIGSGVFRDAEFKQPMVEQFASSDIKAPLLEEKTPPGADESKTVISQKLQQGGAVSSVRHAAYSFAWDTSKKQHGPFGLNRSLVNGLMEALDDITQKHAEPVVIKELSANTDAIRSAHEELYRTVRASFDVERSVLVGLGVKNASSAYEGLSSTGPTNRFQFAPSLADDKTRG